ncbi:hypothetical protein CC80DRAFT_572362 [Byssothecium circinans]|uniref:Helicase C-terminal domain-containing protein n=1 Tax=Byssothecium circinans TaxID=147558 RepID=A0A6A5TJP7_9PLEO|nr:hypothetical protein CC80DRAFT_572362 [Byssothecium circinans]
MDWPRTILDYAQESGRAGRDGSRSEAIIIGQEGDERACDGTQTKAEQALVQLYVEGESGVAGCRRVVLDGYLDRREMERVGCEEGEEPCDVCREPDVEIEEGESSEDNSEEEETEVGGREREDMQDVFKQRERERQGPRQTLIQHRQQEFADVEWLRRQLAWWVNQCGICEAAGDRQSEHDVRRCWRQESRSAKEAIKTIKEQIKFKRYSGCF